MKIYQHDHFDAQSCCSLMLSKNSFFVPASVRKVPFRTVVCVKELWAMIPRFSQHPWVAWMQTPRLAAPVAFSISLTISLANSSWRVPLLEHHWAILVYLLRPINFWAAMSPMQATPTTGWWWWLHMLRISLRTTSIPSYLSSESLGKAVASGLSSYLPHMISLKYILASLLAVSLLLGSVSLSISRVSSTFSKANVVS